jgi:hypothetical protein
MTLVAAGTGMATLDGFSWTDSLTPPPKLSGGSDNTFLDRFGTRIVKAGDRMSTTQSLGWYGDFASDFAGALPVYSGRYTYVIAYHSGATAKTVTYAVSCAPDPATVPIVVASVTIQPTALSLQVGGTATVTAVAKAADGSTISGKTVAWSSSSPSVATVSTAGVVTAVASGTTTIIATIDNATASIVATVSAPPSVSKLLVDAITSVRINGQTATIAPIAPPGPPPTGDSVVVTGVSITGDANTQVLHGTITAPRALSKIVLVDWTNGQAIAFTIPTGAGGAAIRHSAANTNASAQYNFEVNLSGYAGDPVSAGVLGVIGQIFTLMSGFRICLFGG